MPDQFLGPFRTVLYFCLDCGSLDLEAEQWGVATRELRGADHPPVWTTETAADKIMAAMPVPVRNDTVIE